jgi:dTDP-4-amino-4,6-dideoxygalactose transaminase
MDKVIQLFRPRYEVEECINAIRKVLETGWTGLGPQSTEFEKQWCEYTGAKHSHFVSSATAALHLAVRLLDLPKGSIIATTPITFVSTNAAIVYEGHIPCFCDVGNDLSLSFESVKKAIEEKGAKAVMWVHYGGNVSEDFYELMDYVADNPDIKVIEDCAHAAGAFYDDRTRVGSRTDTISCFSFHSVKNLPIMDGGMLCVSDQRVRERAGRLSWLGIDKSTYSRTVNGTNEVYKWAYDVPELGWKYNGNDIAASIGLVQLKYLDRDNAYRQALYHHYMKCLEFQNEFGIAAGIYHNDGSSHHLMVADIENRDGVIAALKANGYAPGVHYLPNYKFPAMNYDHSLCIKAEEMARNIISLPNHLEVTFKDVEAICEVVKNA